MIKNYSVRTDLALEEKERFESDHVEISGVVLEEDYDEASELRVTRVEIKTENGAKAMGKPVGTYSDRDCRKGMFFYKGTDPKI